MATPYANIPGAGQTFGVGGSAPAGSDFNPLTGQYGAATQAAAAQAAAAAGLPTPGSGFNINPAGGITYTPSTNGVALGPPVLPGQQQTPVAQRGPSNVAPAPQYAPGAYAARQQQAAAAPTGAVTRNMTPPSAQPGLAGPGTQFGAGNVNPMTLGGDQFGAGGGYAGPGSPSLADFLSGAYGLQMPSSAGGYGLNPFEYANPNEAFLQQWGMHDLASMYGAQGDMLSGAAMRGALGYGQGLAQSTSWMPALQTAQGQQQTAIALDQANRQFAYNQALNNQTIPWQQQMQLAQLGLQGSQGQAYLQAQQAALNASLAQGMGAAQGQGTIGGGNIIGNAINSSLGGLTLGPTLAQQAAMGNYYNSLANLYNPGMAQPTV